MPVFIRALLLAIISTGVFAASGFCAYTPSIYPDDASEVKVTRSFNLRIEEGCQMDGAAPQRIQPGADVHEARLPGARAKRHGHRCPRSSKAAHAGGKSWGPLVGLMNIARFRAGQVVSQGRLLFLHCWYAGPNQPVAQISYQAQLRFEDAALSFKNMCMAHITRVTSRFAPVV